MKKSFFVVLGCVVLATLTAHADPRCVADATDPYDPGYVMSKGKYQGQCMDASEERAPVILSEDQNQITFANFWHDGKFWLATVPLNGIERGIFHTEYMSSDIPWIKPAHVQLRFVMKKDSGVILVPQAGKDQATSQQIINDLILSIEYMAPSGVDYDLIPGEFKAFRIAYTFFSAQALTQFIHEDDVSGDGPDIVNQYGLKLSGPQLGAVFREAVHEGERYAYDHSYDTLIRNCATQLFKVLDSSLVYQTKVKPFKISILSILDPVAKPSLKALQDRNILDTGLPLPTFNQEYGL